MKKAQIQIGGVYSAKVSGKLVGVKIVAINPHKGWDALNLATQKMVRIKTAQRLRAEFKDPTRRVATVVTAGSTPTKADKAAAKAEAMKAKAIKAAEKAEAQGAAMKAQMEQAKTKAAAKDDGHAKTQKLKAPRKPSGLDLAAEVLADAGTPMTADDIAKAAIKRGWQTKGKTPDATLYAAMLREVDNKPGESRFEKTGRGLFAATRKN